MLIFVLATLGFAQADGGDVPSLNGQVLRPSIDASRTLTVNDSDVRDSGTGTLRALLHYTHDPVVYLDVRRERRELVTDLAQLDVLAGYTLGPIRIGVDVPVFLRSAGELGGETGLGDIAPDLKLRLRDRSRGGLGLAGSVRVPLPTSTMNAPLGNKGLGYEVEGIVDGQVGKTLLVANLGLRGVPESELENTTWDDALSARLAAAYAVTANSGVSVELSGLLGVRDPSDAAALPAEVLLGGYSGLGRSGLTVRGGVGTGITPGIGAPVFRGLLSLGWQPQPKGRVATAPIGDEPAPRVVEEPVAAAELGEKPAVDPIVKVEQPTAVTEPVEDPPAVVTPPVTDPVEEPVEETKPEAQSDVSGGPDTPVEAPKVSVTGSRIDLRDTVYFNTNQASIQSRSYDLLNEVAQLIQNHPELARIRIEGHTDSRGSAAYNLDLSKRRAASVRRYLIEKGVSSDRLESQGYGESKPLRDEQTPEAWTLNRRVDFFVVDRTDD